MGISLAASRPGACSGCFQSKTDKRMVDLGAAYDGPTFRDEAGQLISVDDNIVCEDCIREAAMVLSLDENPTADLERQLEEARKIGRAWQRYAEGLEGALAHRPEPKKRPPGRPARKPTATA